MSQPKPAASAAGKHNIPAIIWGSIAVLCFLAAVMNGIRADNLSKRVHYLGQVESSINTETGESKDIVYVNFGAPVYEDVGSSQPLGTFYSQLSEEEFLKFLDENNIVIGITYDAQSAPSEEEPLYRVIGENFWVQVVAPEVEETEVPTT